MEIVVALIAACCVVAIIAAAATKSSRTSRLVRFQPLTPSALAAARRRSAALRVRHAIATRARELQIPLLHLREAPDFRRAASAALAARDVPVAFRRRQFQRFKVLITRRFIERAIAGADVDALHQSLQLLVTALGVGKFEADYIRDQAVTRARSVRPQASCADRIQALEREHRQRITAIERGLNRHDEDLVEQLTEAEERRHRDALLALFDEPSNHLGHPATEHSPR